MSWTLQNACPFRLSLIASFVFGVAIPELPDGFNSVFDLDKAFQIVIFIGFYPFFGLVFISNEFVDIGIGDSVFDEFGYLDSCFVLFLDDFPFLVGKRTVMVECSRLQSARFWVSV